MRGRSTQRPRIDNSAGSTVTDPSTATETTRMVPIANAEKIEKPDRNMPDIATATAMPETTTARPDVAATTEIACSTESPFARSSRSRRM